MSARAQPVDVVEALAEWANEKDVGMAEWKRRAGIVDAVAELVEAARNVSNASGILEWRRLDAAIARVQGGAA
jgi:hypothetical protein